MKDKTKSQRMAKAAYDVANQSGIQGFAQDFPTLVHSCGLAQAFVFAKAKGHSDYRKAITHVLNEAGWDFATDVALEQIILSAPVIEYIRLSRDALLAAEWIKRYAEAYSKEAAHA